MANGRMADDLPLMVRSMTQRDKFHSSNSALRGLLALLKARRASPYVALSDSVHLGRRKARALR